MKTWEVTIPIAGHALLTVEAETEAEAIRVGLEEASIKDVEEWSALERFAAGNVNYCPRPWRAEATSVSDDDEFAAPERI